MVCFCPSLCVFLNPEFCFGGDGNRHYPCRCSRLHERLRYLCCVFSLVSRAFAGSLGHGYAFGPRVGRLYGKSELEWIERLYKTTSVGGLGWTLPFAVVLVIFSQQLMGTFFGSGYVKGRAALALLVVGFAADEAAGCNITLLTMIGKPWLVMMNGLAGGCLRWVSVCL